MYLQGLKTVLNGTITKLNTRATTRLTPAKIPSVLMTTLFITSIFIMIVLWLPFGFSLSGLIEEWSILGTYIQSGIFFFIDTHTPLAEHVLRPVCIFPHSLAYFLDPNSFAAWHYLLMLSLIIKSISSGYLIWKATGKTQWAVIMSILMVLYPADTMQLSFRALHIDWSISLMLLSCFLCVFSLQHGAKWTAYGVGILASLIFLSAIGMYETALMFLGLPFLVLYVRHGCETTYALIRKKLALVFIWLSCAGIYALYAYIISLKIQTYQSNIMGEQTLINLLAQALNYLFSVGVLRCLVGGWFDAFGILLQEYTSYGYLYIALSTILISLPLVWISKIQGFSEPQKKHSFFIALRLAAASFILVIVGYLPFLCSLSHVLITQRTYLFASVGGAMFWVAVLMMLSSGSNKLATYLSCILIFMGIGMQLFQFHHYVQIASKQKQILRNIVEQFNGDLHDKTLLIQDESNALNRTWMFLNGNLMHALSYIYDHPIPMSSIQVCHIPSHHGWQLSDGIMHPGACIEKKDSWVFQYPALTNNANSPPPLVISKSKILSLVIKPDGSVPSDPTLSAHRYKLYHDNTNTSLRFRHILLETNWINHFKPLWTTPMNNRYKFQFGKWWSLDLPFNGQGLGESEWTNHYFHHEASAWKVEKDAILHFDIHPSPGPYLLSVKLSRLSDTIRDSIKIHVNQHLVHYKWVTPEIFEARIASNYLLSGTNSITLTSSMDEKWQVSFMLSSIEITPITDARH